MAIETKEINGEPSYLIDGEPYLRVTAPFNLISAPALAVWRARVGDKAADEISAKASKFGTEVHSACEAKALGLGYKTFKDPKAQGMVDQFSKWLDTEVEKVLLVEEVVKSDFIKVAGRIDLVVQLKKFPKQIAVCDIKTGRIRPYAQLQLAAYWYLLSETNPLLGAEKGIRVILPVRQTKLEPEIFIADLEQDWLVYKDLVNVYRWIKRKDLTKPKKSGRVKSKE